MPPRPRKSRDADEVAEEVWAYGTGAGDGFERSGS